MNLIAQINLQKVLHAVCLAYNAPESKVYQKSRYKDAVTLRIMTAYFARCYTNASLVQIGRFMQKDHSTIIHYINQACDLIDLYEAYQSKAEQIEQTLHSIGLEQLKCIPQRTKGRRAKRKLAHKHSEDTRYQKMLEQAIKERKAKSKNEAPERMPLFGDSFGN